MCVCACVCVCVRVCVCACVCAYATAWCTNVDDVVVDVGAGQGGQGAPGYASPSRSVGPFPRRSKVACSDGP